MSFGFYGSNYAPYSYSNGNQTMQGYAPTSFDFDPLSFGLSGISTMQNLGNTIGNAYGQANYANQQASQNNSRMNLELANVNTQRDAAIQQAQIQATSPAALASSYYPYLAQVQSQQTKSNSLSQLLQALFGGGGALAGLGAGGLQSNFGQGVQNGQPPGASPAKPVNAVGGFASQFLQPQQP